MSWPPQQTQIQWTPSGYGRADELEWAIYNIDGRLWRSLSRNEKRFLLAKRAEYAAELSHYGVPVPPNTAAEKSVAAPRLFATIAVIFAICLPLSGAFWLWEEVTGVHAKQEQEISRVDDCMTADAMDQFYANNPTMPVEPYNRPADCSGVYGN